MSAVILAFNIRLSVYRQFGLKMFSRLSTQFPGLHLLPILTLPQEGIEHRAAKISKQLPELLSSLDISKAHVACYSSSGVDLRYAISELGADKYVKTITTIASPHKGSKLAALSAHRFFKDDLIDPISRLSGIGLRPFHEFVPENMRHFNSFIKDAPSVQYYSLGGQRLPNQCSYALGDTGRYLFLKTENNFQYHNDGVFGYDEITHGTHVTNFEADHGEVLGLYGKGHPQALSTVYEIVNDYEQRHQKVQEATSK